MSRRSLVSVAAVCVVMGAGALRAAGQGRFTHEVHLAVADLGKSVTWYTTTLGFEVVHYGHVSADRTEARLSLERTDLFLYQDRFARADGPSSVIKLGILVPDLERFEERLLRVSPESVVVPRSALPPAPRLEGWPTEHLLATDPDGTFIQVFHREPSVSAPRWFLAAVTVESLDDALRWYTEEAGFTELYRPAGGDPRSLLRLGSFYLEVGEFGASDTAGGAYGVSNLSINATLVPCSDLEPPEGFNLRVCGTDGR